MESWSHGTQQGSTLWGAAAKQSALIRQVEGKNQKKKNATNTLATKNPGGVQQMDKTEISGNKAVSLQLNIIPCKV